MSLAESRVVLQCITGIVLAGSLVVLHCTTAFGQSEHALYTCYLTNRFHFCVRLYCNRSQMTSWRVKNKKVRTRRSQVRDFLFFTGYGVICDLLQYRSTKK